MSNVDVNAAPSKQAKVLGRQIFQSFLLAGERNLNAGMSRAGTAEADFAELFQGVGGEEQTVLRGYFKKQMALSQLQRTGILGDLVKIKITTPLTLSRINLAGLNAVRLTAPKIANGNRNKPKRAGRLDMVLRSIKILDSQDGGLFKKSIDEVSITVIGVDQFGRIRKKSHKLPSIKEGRSGGINRKLISFNLLEDSVGVQRFRVIMCFLERDSGSSINRLLNKFATFVQRELSRANLEAALSSTGLIPAQYVDDISDIFSEAASEFITWLSELLIDGNDFMGEIERGCSIGDVRNWQSTRKESVIRRHGGKWRVRYHWKMRTV